MSFWIRTKDKDGTSKAWAIDIASPMVLVLVGVLLAVLMMVLQRTSDLTLVFLFALVAIGVMLYFVSRSSRQRLRRIALVVLASSGVLLILLLIEMIPLSRAKPPADLKTIEDFRRWQKAAIVGEGTFEDSGETYTVVLGPSGRYFASGPSAYLFDKDGVFLDWTPDMGDSVTRKHKFDLTSGSVADIDGGGR